MYAKDKALFTKQPNLNGNLKTRKLNFMQQIGFIWAFLKYKIRITYISRYNQSPKSSKKYDAYYETTLQYHTLVLNQW